MPVTTYDLFGQPAGFSTLAVDPTDYTMGVQWSVALSGGQTAILTGIRFFSPPGATVRPVTIALWAVSGRSLIHSEGTGVSPIAWSGAAGSGWITATFASPPVLSSGVAYKGSIFDNHGVNFYGAVGAYWSTGPGASGITSGPLSAPNNAGGDGGQDTFTAAVTLTYPLTSSNAANYGVDVVVQVTSPAVVAGNQLASGRTMLRKRLLYADI